MSKRMLLTVGAAEPTPPPLPLLSLSVSNAPAIKATMSRPRTIKVHFTTFPRVRAGPPRCFWRFQLPDDPCIRHEGEQNHRPPSFRASSIPATSRPQTEHRAARRTATPDDGAASDPDTTPRRMDRPWSNGLGLQ